MTDIKINSQSISERWKYAILGGLASLPFTMASYWQSGSEISITPILFGGLFAGYLAKRRVGENRGVGARAGLIGGLPVLWMLSDMLSAVIEIPNPLWFSVVSVGMVFGITILGFGMSALLGEIGGRIGSWLSTRGGRIYPTRASS